MENIRIICTKLLDWYKLHKRDLPWRETQNPYKIWLSEIILQQTRVNQGLDYYYRFIERFPDIETLAEAEEQEVLKYWQGLGYYSRARNLHFTAKKIKNEYEGKFPTSYQEILSLKGIGEYTAAAIASFAYNLPYPAVDGNVFRVISRLFGIKEAIDTGKGKKQFTEIARQLMDNENPGLFNQAMMEFGALQCVPASPDCIICPLQEHCFAYSSGEVNNLPVKITRTKIKTVYLYYFHIRFENKLYLKKRIGKGIWQNLFEFPAVESDIPLTFEELKQHKSFEKIFSLTNPSDFKLILKNQKHVLSHRILYADFFEVCIEKGNEELNNHHLVGKEELIDYPIHRLMELYFEKKFL